MDRDVKSMPPVFVGAAGDVSLVAAECSVCLRVIGGWPQAVAAIARRSGGRSATPIGPFGLRRRSDAGSTA
eukprot:4721277-Alexandrium_andersonii.AAC.1